MESEKVVIRLNGLAKATQSFCLFKGAQSDASHLQPIEPHLLRPCPKNQAALTVNYRTTFGLLALHKDHPSASVYTSTLQEGDYHSLCRGSRASSTAPHVCSLTHHSSSCPITDNKSRRSLDRSWIPSHHVRSLPKNPSHHHPPTRRRRSPASV